MFKDVNEIINRIEQRKNRRHGLEHFKEYMHTIGDPHKKLKAIHVAGTNGKGSTTNDLRSILQEAGYNVGSFTSPYMISHLDRIRINDEYIHEHDFLQIANTYYESWIEWDLSMFEIDMCIACLYFVEYHVDIAVFEVGLGGRLDSTNILDPMVSVITNIGMDHMELLGDTYAKIAREKAGIIKEEKLLVTAENKEECLAVFDECTKAKHTAYRIIEPIDNIRQIHGHMYFDYKDMKDIQLASGARYQCKNAALAIETIQYLNEKKYTAVCKEAIRKGLEKAVWIGRFETVRTKPLTILDGAHNEDGIHALCEAVQDIHNPIIIFSVLKDKNFDDMLKQLQEISDMIFVCPLHNDRALDVHELSKRVGIQVFESFDEAYQKAVSFQRTIIVTGSLYFISEVRSYFM